MHVWHLLSDVLGTFRRRGCPSLAASLAFYSILSLFPMAFLLLYGFSFIVSQDVLGYQFLLGFLKGFLPSLGERLAMDIRRVAELTEVRWIVWLTFGWFGALVFYELDYAMNAVFGTTAHRHPLISTLIAVALIWLLGVLMFVSFVATEAIEILTKYAPRLWGLDLVAIAAHDFLLAYTLPLVLAFASVTCLYRYLPHKRPTWRDATIGGAVFSLLWVAAKAVFVTYLEDAAVYSRLYGSLLEVVLLLLWIYYSAALFLFGAVVAHESHNQQPPPLPPPAV